MSLIMAALFRSRAYRRNVLAALAGLFLGILCGGLLIASLNGRPPVIIHDEYEVDASAAQSGFLRLFISLDRYRDCPSETSRWLWTWVDHQGEKVKQFYPLPQNTTTLSDNGPGQRFILAVPLPPRLGAGQFYYWSKTIAYCTPLPWIFGAVVHESGDIPVRIDSPGPS